MLTSSDFVISQLLKTANHTLKQWQKCSKQVCTSVLLVNFANRPVSKTKDGKDFYNDSNVISKTTCNFWNQKMPLNCVNQRKLNQLNNLYRHVHYRALFNQHTSLSCVLIKEGFHHWSNKPVRLLCGLRN